MTNYYPGDIKEGKIIGIKSYGAFISFPDSTLTGLLHISEISNEFISDINNYLKIGESIKVKILDIDYKENKAKLSLKIVNNRLKKRKSKNNLSNEKINDEMEFEELDLKINDFISDAKSRLNIN